MSLNITQNMLTKVINFKLYVDDVECLSPMLVSNNSVIKAVANDGYLFYEKQTVSGIKTSIFFKGQNPNTGGMAYFPLKLNSDFKTATNTVLNTTSSYISSLESYLNVAPKNTLYVVTISQLEKLNDEHSKLYINNVLAIEGDKAYSGDVLKIIVDDGYKISYDSNNNPICYLYEQNTSTGATVKHYFKVLDDNNLSYDLKNAPNYSNFFYFTLETEIKTNVSHNNLIYKIDDTILKSVNNARYYKNSSGDTVDAGVNILKILDIPIKLTNNLITTPQEIILGVHNTNVKAPQITQDYYDLDLGFIEVPFYNSKDFNNLSIKVSIPFMGSDILDYEHVLGYKISGNIRIFFYTGLCEITLKSSINDLVFFSKTLELNSEVPYISNNSVNNTNIKPTINEFINSFTIEITRNKSFNKDFNLEANIKREKIINGELGFITVNNINLKTKATYSEIDTIISLLKTGVIIND